MDGEDVSSAVADRKRKKHFGFRTRTENANKTDARNISPRITAINAPDEFLVFPTYTRDRSRLSSNGSSFSF